MHKTHIIRDQNEKVRKKEQKITDHCIFIMKTFHINIFKMIFYYKIFIHC